MKRALALVFACSACGGGGEPRATPKTAPRVGEWPRLDYQAQAPDGPLQGIKDDDEARAIREGLQARYGEPFEVSWVSKETFSAPGWPGGAAGRFVAHPRARPELRFGGFNGTEVVDNYDCIRAVQPVLTWAARDDAPAGLVAEHDCEESSKRKSQVRLWLFDDPTTPVPDFLDELQAQLDGLLSAQLDPPKLDGLSLILSVHPPGAGPTAQKVISTSRRAEHARNSARRREISSAKLQWADGAWTRSLETPSHVRVVEEAVRIAVEAHRPEGVAFLVQRLGPSEATLDDIARRPTVREGVEVFVRIDGDYDEQALANWAVNAQQAVDDRIVLLWNVTLCEAGAARPWAKPEECSAGWDEFSVFTLDHAREKPEFWPYPPAF